MLFSGVEGAGILGMFKSLSIYLSICHEKAVPMAMRDCISIVLQHASNRRPF